MGVCASSAMTRASVRDWRASMWQLFGDGNRVTPCARGSCKVGKRPVRYQVANRSPLFHWFAQIPSDWLLEALALMYCFLSKVVGLCSRESDVCSTRYTNLYGYNYEVPYVQWRMLLVYLGVYRNDDESV